MFRCRRVGLKGTVARLRGGGLGSLGFCGRWRGRGSLAVLGKAVISFSVPLFEVGHGKKDVE